MMLIVITGALVSFLLLCSALLCGCGLWVWLVMRIVCAVMLCGLGWRSWDLRARFLLGLRRIDMMSPRDLIFLYFLYYFFNIFDVA